MFVVSFARMVANVFVETPMTNLVQHLDVPTDVLAIQTRYVVVYGASVYTGVSIFLCDTFEIIFFWNCE